MSRNPAGSSLNHCNACVPTDPSLFHLLLLELEDLLWAFLWLSPVTAETKAGGIGVCQQLLHRVRSTLLFSLLCPTKQHIESVFTAPRYKHECNRRRTYAFSLTFAMLYSWVLIAAAFLFSISSLSSCAALLFISSVLWSWPCSVEQRKGSELVVCLCASYSLYLPAGAGVLLPPAHAAAGWATLRAAPFVSPLGFFCPDPRQPVRAASSAPRPGWSFCSAGGRSGRTRAAATAAGAEAGRWRWPSPSLASPSPACFGGWWLLCCYVAYQQLRRDKDTPNT